MPKIIAEYIWIDGESPTAYLRGKTNIITRSKRITKLSEIPKWGFDGSSTKQALSGGSDCGLQPVYFVPDPIRGTPHILVLCEVMTFPDWNPHPSNTRSLLRKIFRKHRHRKPIFGLEQEYTMFDADSLRPHRWPEKNWFPAEQGPYYCGVGVDEVYGLLLKEQHLFACVEAGLSVSGTNAEVMPSQWEFQIGPLPPLEVADQTWVARWILYRLGVDRQISIKLYPKPIPGPWNGAGLHSNFSTKEMRAGGRGKRSLRAIESACERLGRFHKAHMKEYVYGAGNRRRLTGLHETCDYHKFRWGVGDRSASIRIPAKVAMNGHGYLEDRRPAANMDPYRVAYAIIATVCDKGFDPKVFQYFKKKRGNR